MATNVLVVGDGPGALGIAPSGVGTTCLGPSIAHLGADEIHRGKAQKFYTVLSDLVHGEVVGRIGRRTA